MVCFAGGNYSEEEENRAQGAFIKMLGALTVALRSPFVGTMEEELKDVRRTELSKEGGWRVSPKKERLLVGNPRTSSLCCGRCVSLEPPRRVEDPKKATERDGGMAWGMEQEKKKKKRDYVEGRGVCRRGKVRSRAAWKAVSPAEWGRTKK